MAKASWPVNEPNSGTMAHIMAQIILHSAQLVRHSAQLMAQFILNYWKRPTEKTEPEKLPNSKNSHRL